MLWLSYQPLSTHLALQYLELDLQPCIEHGNAMIDNEQDMHMSFNSLYGQVKELDLVMISHVRQLAIASLRENYG